MTTPVIAPASCPPALPTPGSYTPALAEALREHWPPILAEVYEHSKAGSADANAALKRARVAASAEPALPAP